MRHLPAFNLALLAPKFWPMWVILGLLGLLALLPWRVRGWLADGVAAILWQIPSRRKAVAQTNIELCFPDMSDNQRRAVLRQNLRVTCHMYLSFGVLLFGAIERVQRRLHVTYDPQFTRALEENAQIILFTPHWLSFEYIGQCIAAEHPLVSIVRLHAGNAFLDWAVTRMRTRNGAAVYGHLSPLIALVRAVRQGRWLFYLPDEDAGDTVHVFAPLFGRAKATSPALEKLAQACQARICPVSMDYDPDQQRFRMIYHAPLPQALDPEEMNVQLESLIKARPEQYAWSSKLFKTRPAGEAKVYG